MAYDVDDDYEFELGAGGVPKMPAGMATDGNLYVLPNGKYLPRGVYEMEDGSSLIYEPAQLSPYAEMLAQFNA